MSRETVRPRVVIVGAGFAGLNTARALSGEAVDVLVLDRNNFHTFVPLLYQVGSGEIGASQIAYPVRSVFRKSPNVRFRMLEARELETTRKRLLAEDREINYDVLVIGVGSAPHFFGIPGARENAFTLKWLDDGLELRNQILSRFELAVTETDPERCRELLTFVVVGGGTTGVEFAGALMELVEILLRKDYPELGPGTASVILLEALDRVLLEFPEELAAYAHRRLEQMGVEVRLGAKVTEVTQTGVIIDGDTRIASESVIWTAGVQGHPLARRWGLPTAAQGRIPVEPTLQVKGHPTIYAVGDIAHLEADGRPLPMIAPVAQQQGEAAARNILRQLAGRKLEHFTFDPPGRLATIGRNHGVAEVAGRRFTGFPAWALWAGVHFAKLRGLRNRAHLLLYWLEDYVFWERPARLVFPFHEVADVIAETPEPEVIEAERRRAGVRTPAERGPRRAPSRARRAVT